MREFMHAQLFAQLLDCMHARLLACMNVSTVGSDAGRCIDSKALTGGRSCNAEHWLTAVGSAELLPP